VISMAAAAAAVEVMVECLILIGWLHRDFVLA
jgi:hypothetical protein